MISKILPFLTWFKDYDLRDLKADAIAGLTVALVLVPQSMAYAQLAGLPAYYGLYAAFLPPMVAALFGSSRQLATGPVAVVSLMTSASLEPLATAGSQGYISYAILLAVMVGIFQFSLGALRLGLVVNFLSHPVVNGFTNAAAIIIATSQLSKIFGVYVDKASHHYETILRVIEASWHYTHWPTLGMAALAFAIMYSLKRISPRIPNVLFAVIITTVLSWATGFQHNVKVPIESIRDQLVQKRIELFNEATDSIPYLAGQRAKFFEVANRARKEGDSTTELYANYELDLLSSSIEKSKSRAAIQREALRSVLFRGVKTTDDGITFYSDGNVPSGMEHDHKAWHLKLDNCPLDENGLLFIGGGAVVGVIPRGLPSLSVPNFDISTILQLFPYAAIISLLGFMEAISIAKAMASKTGQRLDPNQELIGQGIANLAGAIGRSYPTSGSFSRSAVNLQAGAVSGLSSVFTSLTVVIVLLFFTPLLYFLHQAVLAAVIMMAVMGLINVTGFLHAWRAQWYDGAISIITFLCTLIFAPHLDKGIMIGVVLSLIVFLYKSMRPRVVTLSRTEDNGLRCTDTHGLKKCQYLALVRFDGPLFFANTSYLEEKITEIMMKRGDLRHIVIVCNGINDIDASGEEALSLLFDRVRSAGLDISLSGVNEAVMHVLVRTHLLEKIGENNIYPTMEKAIQANYTESHKKSTESACPLLSVCRLAEG